MNKLPLVNHRRVQLGIVLLGVALVLPSLRAGFFADDYLQIASLEGWSANPAGPWDLYSFVPRDAAVVEQFRARGALPWFGAPGLELSFWRPLSSALMRLDHAMFGRWAPPYHAHSLLWYAALLVVAGALLRRLASPPLATLALLIFCLDDAHALTVTFVAARNAAVSCVLVWLGLLAHLRWRTKEWRAGMWLAPLLGAAGLAAGEMGLGALAYLLAWECCERRPGWRRALVPTAALIAAYLLFYRLTGAGAHNSATYLDPFGDSLGYLRELPARTLLLLGNLLVRTPIDFALIDDHLRLPLIVVGAAAVLTVAIWLPRALRRLPAAEAAVVRFMAFGAAAALLAATPGMLGDRLLFAAGLGGAVVVAALLCDAWTFFRARRARVLAVVALAAFGLPNVVFAAAALPAKVLFFGKIFDGYRRLAREAEIEAPVAARVVVVALDDLVAINLPAIRAFEQSRTPEDLRDIIHRGRSALPLPDTIGIQGTTVLSEASTAHRLRRTATDTLELSTPDGTLLDGAWAGTLRARALPLPRGSVVRTSFMTATVVDDRAGQPTRVTFQFDRPLDDPSLVFLTLSKGDLRRLPLPEVGDELSLPKLRPFEAAVR